MYKRQGMSVTPERAAAAAFSDSYVDDDIVMICRADSAYAGATTFDELADASILGQAATMYDDVIAQIEMCIRDRRIPAQRMFGERTAMNHPMQGSAADIIKIAMVRVAERLRACLLYTSLGSDICMQLDQGPGYPATRKFVERAVELSSMWAERCYKAHTRDDQALFGIVQGLSLIHIWISPACLCFCYIS